MGFTTGVWWENWREDMKQGWRVEVIGGKGRVGKSQEGLGREEEDLEEAVGRRKRDGRLENLETTWTQEH